MNLDDDSKERVTDLRLSLGSNQGTHLIENTGTGANAASRADMAYVASDHLTELVWSPRKGLSIKCANCCARATRSTHMPFTVTSNRGTSLSQMNEANAAAPVTPAKLLKRKTRSVFASQSAHLPDSEGPRYKIRADSSLCQKDVPIESRLSDFERQSSNTINKDETLFVIQPTMQLRVGAVPAVSDSIVQPNKKNSCRIQKDLALELNIEENLLAVRSHSSDSVFHMEAKVESHQAEVSRAGDNTCQDESSPAESRIHEYHRKGKGKVLSDGNVGSISRAAKALSTEYVGSHGSEESCNSVGSFPPQHNKQSLRQEFINSNKRFKGTAVQPVPCSTTLVNGKSSFMSWISNMIKGSNHSNVEEAPCLTLTLAPAGPRHENHEWKLISHDNNRNHGHQSAGFPNLFQSLYGRSSKGHEGIAMTGEFHKNKLPFGVCIGGNNMVDIAPIAIREMTSSSGKGDQSTSGNGERELMLPGALSSSIDNREHVSPDENITCNPFTAVQISKYGSDRSSPDKCRIENGTPQESKMTSTNVTDPLQSFWTTRFCPKISGPESAVDHQTQMARIDNQTSLLPSNRNIVGSTQPSKALQPKALVVEDPNDLAGGLENETSDSDASVGLKGDNQASERKIDQRFLPERHEGSEAMASIFARRLDALKNMAPNVKTENADGALTTCFFCGKKGHNLRNCSKVTDDELDFALQTNEYLDRAVEFPCICIWCFQLGHRATKCSTAPSKKAVRGPLVIDKRERLDTPGSKINTEIMIEGKDQPLAAGASAYYDHSTPATGRDMANHYSESDLCKHEFKERSVVPLSSFGKVQNTDILKGFFCAVRKLCLSRRDILKLIDSNIPLSNLEGFFLRLRLGNWDKGLGGTGYHVACIDGVRNEGSSQGLMLGLSVSIGSIKCVVGSQSISNQGFVEDELMVWWSETVKNGIKLPTKEELTKKLADRNKLPC